jgi:hypothetical protein
MPTNVATMPSAQAATIAVPIVLVTRSAVAAGPMSSAVERMVPMAMEDRPTDTARASMNSRPMRRRPMLRAEASSGLRELRSSGRWMAATRATVAALRAMTTGTVEEAMVKIDPKRICWVAPVVALLVVSR